MWNMDQRNEMENVENTAQEPGYDSDRLFHDDGENTTEEGGPPDEAQPAETEPEKPKRRRRKAEEGQDQSDAVS